jgi:hypothetical protein
MRLREFVRAARREFEAVPEEFRRGVAGPVVVRRARRHPRLPGNYTLGQCVPVSPLFTGDGPQESTVFLYYGSFVACAMRDPAFDVAAEIRETVRHEILHHVEDRAGAPDLRNEDAAEEQNEFRLAGEPFDPGFHRLGTREGDGLWRVGPDLFLEAVLRGREVETARREGLAVRWEGSTYRVDPEELARLPAFVPLVETEEGGELVVVVRKR